MQVRRFRPRAELRTPMQLYNSLARRKQTFSPRDPQRVTLYVCGPTVYSYPHIGNARPAVVFDVLYRLLRDRFPNVVYARNITDLDDKINAAAAAESVGIDVITQRFARVYHEDMEALGVLAPDIEPCATAHIPEMVSIIELLLASGHAYVADRHVLFHVPSFPDYGRLSRRDRREMLAGARVDVAPYKRDDADFVLWKPSTAGQPAWDSPWGPGRPGWHTECVCMIEKHLGQTIDIHGGGHDLQFPHHENEIAQARCAHGDAPLARFWMHNGFVNVNAEKMSKSVGNVLLVRELLEQAPGEAIRFALLSAHYRKPLEWNEQTLPRACRVLDRLYAALEGSPVDAGIDIEVPEPIRIPLEDDLNTPLVIASLHAMAQAMPAPDAPERAREQARLRAGGRLLGLLQEDANAWTVARRGRVQDVDEIERLVREREQARERKDYPEADRLRGLLDARGIVLKDGPTGTQWRKAG